MRRFMGPTRLWGSEDGPEEDWVKPHVLWLPQDDPHVLDYFGRLHEIVTRFPDVITPIADEDLHMTIQSVRQLNTSGVRVDDEQLATASVAVQRQLDDVDPFQIQIGPARASGSAGIVEIWPEDGLSLGSRPIQLPGSLDGLMQELVASRGTDTLIPHESDWLFPGRSAGQPIHETRLRRRLNMIGVKSGQGRSTALFALAEQVPAGLLSKMLGVHISVAVTWQRASGGDRMGSAADVAARSAIRAGSRTTDAPSA
ncbi:hypothetical protein ACFWM0_06310 [Streptomyces sp. NPDC058405]|uniref:hypothetical protein n=1 Tax=unclassified Streptomyces TaxID=2593676 RepID=UPI00364D73EF